MDVILGERNGSRGAQVVAVVSGLRERRSRAGADRQRLSS